MTIRFPRALLLPLLAPAFLFFAGCATTGSDYEELEPNFLEEPLTREEQEVLAQDPRAAEDAEPAEDEGEVPIVVAESEPPVSPGTLPAVIVADRLPERFEIIGSHVADARVLLRDVDLEYVFTGKGKKEVLRGRPVAFALWSESKQAWSVAHIEIPRPTIKWRPGGRPISFRVLTPGIKARHVKGTGAERLMFAFSENGEDLKVYGRKFPVFDNALLKGR